MGRPKKQIDDVALLSMRSEGKKLKEISEELGITEVTIARRLAFLRNQKGILIKYRELQGLQLTEHQARILEAVEAKDFEDASLLELMNAFNVLKKAEIAIQVKDSYKVPGLLRHLEAMEGLE